MISMHWSVPMPVKQLNNTTGRIVALTELKQREKYLTAGNISTIPNIEDTGMLILG